MPTTIKVTGVPYYFGRSWAASPDVQKQWMHALVCIQTGEILKCQQNNLATTTRSLSEAYIAFLVTSKPFTDLLINGILQYSYPNTYLGNKQLFATAMGQYTNKYMILICGEAFQGLSNWARAAAIYYETKKAEESIVADINRAMMSAPITAFPNWKSVLDYYSYIVHNYGAGYSSALFEVVTKAQIEEALYGGRVFSTPVEIILKIQVDFKGPDVDNVVIESYTNSNAFINYALRDWPDINEVIEDIKRRASLPQLQNS